MNRNVERDAMENIRLADRLASALNTAQVRYCHWKSNEHLQAGLEGKTDLDVLVDRADCGSFLKVITDLGFRKVISSPETTYVAVENWIGFCEKTGILIHLHVHYELVTGMEFVKEYAFPWSRYVLDTAVRDVESGFLITDPNVEIILLILRLSVKAKRRTLLVCLITGKRPYIESMQKELAYLQARLSCELMEDALEEMFEGHSPLRNLVKRLVFKKELNAKELIAVKRGIQNELGTARRYGKMTAAQKSFIGSMKLKKNLVLEHLGSEVMRRKRFETGGTVIAIIGHEDMERKELVRNLEKWLKWKMDVHTYPLTSGDKWKSEEGVRKTRQMGGIVLLEGSPDVPEIFHKEEARRSGKKSPYGLRVVPDVRTREEILKKRLSAFRPDLVIRMMESGEHLPTVRPMRKQIEEGVHEGSATGHQSMGVKEAKVYEVDSGRSSEEIILNIRRVIWKNL